LPLARRARYLEVYCLSFKEADALTQDGPTGALLDDAVALGADPKRCVNLLLGRGAALANERNCTIAEIGLTPGQLAELAKMVHGGEVNATSAARIFDLMVAEKADPRALAEREGLLAVHDSGAIEAWVEEVVRDNPKAVADANSPGKKQKKALGYLAGQVMQKSRGQADPRVVNELLARRFGVAG